MATRTGWPSGIATSCCATTPRWIGSCAICVVVSHSSSPVRPRAPHSPRLSATSASAGRRWYRAHWVANRAIGSGASREDRPYRNLKLVDGDREKCRLLANKGSASLKGGGKIVIQE